MISAALPRVRAFVASLRRPSVGVGLAFVALFAFVLAGPAARSGDSPGTITPKLTATNPQGYWMVGTDGGIFSFGGAGFHGSTGGIHLNKPIVGMTATRSSSGYWFVASDGGVFAFGDAPFLGSTGGIHLNKPIVGMAATPSGNGYWLVASDGGIFSFGDAAFLGSTGGIHLNKPIVGMAATPSGNGYWLVASDGGIFTFGDAPFAGSAGGINLNRPIVAMAPTSTGNGYWFVASDGGIFNYGDAAFLGSAGGSGVSAPVVGMGSTPLGLGYWLVGADGSLYTFGDAGNLGSLTSTHLNSPIVGMAAPLFGSSIPSILSYDVPPASAVSLASLNDVKVRVLDANNNFLSNSTIPVTMATSTAPSGSTLGGTLTRNAVNGIATFPGLTLDKVGSYRLAASASGVPAVVSDPITITPGAVTHLAFGTQPSGAVSQATAAPVTVQLLDAANNVTTSTANVVVSLTGSPVGTTLSGTLTKAAVAGVATFNNLSVDKIGSYTLTATSGALPTAASSTFAITPGAVTHLAFGAQPTAALSAATIPAVTVQLLDAANNVTTSTANVAVALTGSPVGTTLSGTLTKAAVAGVATFNDLSVDKVGAYTLTATSAALPTVASSSFTITPASASKLLFGVQPSSAVSQAAMASSVTVQITDAANNVITTNSTSPVTVALTGSPVGPTLGGTLTRTASAGVATFPGLSVDKIGSYTLSATSGLLTGGPSSSFTITPGTVTHLAFGAQPTATLSAATISPAVTVQLLDAANNVTTSTSNVAVALTGSPVGTTLSGTLTSAAVAGTATFNNLSVDKVGTYTLTATSGVLPTLASSSFGITPAAPTHLVFLQQPTGAVSQATMSPAVTVQLLDAQNNVATNFSPTSCTTPIAGCVFLSLTGDPVGVTLNGIAAQPAVNGVATFSNLSVDKVGTYTLSAAAGSLTGIDSSSFTITPGAATKVVFGAQPVDAVSNATIPTVTARIVDAANNLTTSTDNVTVALTTPGTSTLAGTATAAAVNGVASFADLSVNKVGTYTLTATSGTLTSATSSSFIVTPGNAAKLAFASSPGNSLGGGVLTSTGVNVLDAAGNVVTGSTDLVTLTFDTNPSAGTLSGTVAKNAVNGVATFTNLSVDKVGTGYKLNAASGSLTAAISNAFNVTLGPKAKLGFFVQPAASVAGSALTASPVVQVLDAGGNLVTAATDGIALALGTNPGSGTLSGSVSHLASGGQFTFTGLSINKTGTGYTLVATSLGLAQAESQPFNITPGTATKLAFGVQPTSVVAAPTTIAPAVTVVVNDAQDNVVTTASDTVTIAIATNPASGVLGGTVATNAVNGVATFADLTINKLGTGYTLTATAPSRSSATSSAFNVSAGPVDHLLFSVQPPTSANGGSVITAVKVAIVDVNGNTVPTATNSIVMTKTAGTGSLTSTLSGTLTRTAVSGVATFDDLVIDKAASGYQFDATTTGLATSNTMTSNAFAIAVGPAAKLGYTAQPPATTIAGATMNPVLVAVQDLGGNTVTSSSASVALAFFANPGGGSLAGTLTRNAASGVATFNDLTIPKTGTAYTFQATSSPLTAATSNAFEILPGTASTISYLVQPGNAVSMVAVQSPGGVQVVEKDANSNVVTTDSTSEVTVALTGSNPGVVLGGTSNHTLVNGVATFNNLTIDKVGTYSLTAARTGLSSIQSNSFQITPAPASQLAFTTQPANSTGGATMSNITVEVRDAQGNARTTDNATQVSLAINNNPGSGQLLGLLTKTASGGIATFNGLSIDKVGTGYTLDATATALTGVTSNPFDINTGAINKLGFFVQPIDTHTTSVITPNVQVEIQDLGGNRVLASTNAITVTIGTNAGGTGTLLGGTPLVSAINGVATFNDLTINNPGSGFTLHAQGVGVSNGGTSQTFNVYSDPAALVFNVSPSATVAGLALAPAVQVHVHDSGGRLVKNASDAVTMSIANNAGGGTLSGSLTQAASNGVATFSNLTINKVGVGYTLQAASGTLTAGTSSAFDITAGAASQLVYTAQPATTQAGSTMAQVNVAVADASGNTVTTRTDSITLAFGANPGSSTFSGTLTRAAVSGVATFNDLSLNKVGTNYTLTAAPTIVGLTPVTSSTFNITPGVAAKLAYTQQPTTRTAAQAFSPSPVVQVLDANNNLVTSSVAPVTLAITSGTGNALGVLSGTAVNNAVSGVATFAGLSIDKAGTGYTLTATSGSLTSTISNAFNVTVGTVAKLGFGQQPATGVHGVTMPAVTVELQDAGGNIVTAATNSIALAIANNPSAGVLTGGGAQAPVNGVVTFNSLSINNAGVGYTLQATATTLTGATSSAFTMT